MESPGSGYFEFLVATQVHRWCAYQAIPEPDIQNVAAADCSAPMAAVPDRFVFTRMQTFAHLRR